MTAISLIGAECPLLLVGCGKMGRALAQGWIARGLDPVGLWVAEPAGVDSLPDGARATQWVAALPDLDGKILPRIVVLAVKPQMMDAVLGHLKSLIDPSTLIISIAAGIRINQLETGLGCVPPVVRAMPNTPAAIGKGITVAVPNDRADEDSRLFADALLEAGGDVEWAADEGIMDAVTAVSGSGPAYVFHLTECLAKAGEAAGLDPALAYRLAAKTVTGAGALMETSADDAATLRENVTSPGGTTAAALDVLRGTGALEELMTRAVKAAAKRGKELSK